MSNLLIVMSGVCWEDKPWWTESGGGRQRALPLSHLATTSFCGTPHEPETRSADLIADGIEYGLAVMNNLDLRKLENAIAHAVDYGSPVAEFAHGPTVGYVDD